MLLNAIAPPICAGCGDDARAAEPLCARCRGDLRWLAGEPIVLGGVSVWAPVAYEGPARGVVGALKFRGARRAASAMAATITANVPPGWLDGRVLVPVPLHASRARRRGYNQAELLASEIARRTGIETADCLVRAGPRGTQVGRDRAQRLAGIAGTVSVAEGRSAPRLPVLVDDVVTTGATLTEAARAVRAAGGEVLGAACAASTPLR
jgi:ComF family protein